MIKFNNIKNYKRGAVSIPFLCVTLFVGAWIFSSCDVNSISEETLTGTATITLNNIDVGTSLDRVSIISNSNHLTMNTIPEIGTYSEFYDEDTKLVKTDVLDGESITFEVTWSETKEVRTSLLDVSETPNVDDLDLTILITRYNLTYTTSTGRTKTDITAWRAEDETVKDGDVLEYNLGILGPNFPLTVIFERIK